jgi:hypothetical protein
VGERVEDVVTLVGDNMAGVEGVTEPVGKGCALSALTRGEPVLVMPGGGVLVFRVDGSMSPGLASEEGAGPRRPNRDNKRPPAFFLCSVAVAGSSFSIIRQPGGKTSSCKTSGLDFTEASHAVDPFEAMYKAIGLDRVISMCRVSRRASFICFDVKLFENGILWGRVKS